MDATIVGIAITSFGCMIWLLSYFLAQSRGVLRYFAYDRLTPTGKVVWCIGALLTAAGLIFLVATGGLRL